MQTEQQTGTGNNGHQSKQQQQTYARKVNEMVQGVLADHSGDAAVAKARDELKKMCSSQGFFNWLLWFAARKLIQNFDFYERRQIEQKPRRHGPPRSMPPFRPHVNGTANGGAAAEQFKRYTKQAVRDWYSWKVPFIDKRLGDAKGTELLVAHDKCGLIAARHTINQEFLLEVSKRVKGEKIVREELELEDLQRIAILTGLFKVKEEAA